MLLILEKKGLVTKQSAYRGLLFLTDEGKAAAEQVCAIAGRAVELSGKDLSEPMRENFYPALESITANLRKLSRDGIPKDKEN